MAFSCNGYFGAYVSISLLSWWFWKTIYSESGLSLKMQELDNQKLKFLKIHAVQINFDKPDRNRIG